MVSAYEAKSLIALAGSLFLGGFGAWAMASWAGRLGLLDEPGERSSHRVPTPRGGGVGILSAALLSALILDLDAIYWVPGAILSAVSFLDDRRGLPPLFRLMVQLFAAAAVLPVLVPTGAGFGWAALSGVFWGIFLVGTANFFNFMDGVNGMAGISGAVGFGLLAVYAWLSGSSDFLGLFSACLALACLGFLPFNFPLARVFLGDVGSVFLGFQFAVLTAVLSRNAWEFLVLAGALTPIYYDAILTLLRRLLNREDLFQAHRQHLYQVLVHSRGWGHGQVSLAYGAGQLLTGSLLMLFWFSGHPWGSVLVLAVAAAGFAWLSQIVSRRGPPSSWPTSKNKKAAEGTK